MQHVEMRSRPALNNLNPAFEMVTTPLQHENSNQLT